ncbi:Putative multidrug export ATP-binding/permease protein [Candidatus Rhabdochlamydia oedothoracis]|uniref:Multidrug export ATP-binding/permease protein n=1 Tax=Candidatus Rhabdochlamydia oedothoracis TaxID=2720720 RepID=A0ABX8UYV4_9BACT|nr:MULTISPECIES: ABC transporter ATP-binding protein [Rhabdochlamydia]KAG6559960.1 putative multidrug export ATP-binding/permease protein [Candidatus Rhabdochlamydia sp. W815]MCL6756298.1 ABC transporter ATP-binding protein/permease [Candidatus Rhabdochlamydia oedothoracis]QYF48109.1 Putative multidrug export ATP-binding/permease protein [Candidatus Rhabdochlamydia oedothoracis]
MKKTLIHSVLKNYQLKILAIGFLGIFWSLRDIATPYIVKTILDSTSHLNAQEISECVFRSLLTIIFIWVLMEVCMRIQGRLLLRTIPDIRKELCEKLFKRVKAYSYSFFLENVTGTLSDKIHGATQGIEALLSICLSSFIPILSHMAFSLMITVTINLKLFFLFLVWMLLHLGITWKMGMRSLEKVEHLASVRSHLHGKIVDSFFNIFTIKIFCRETDEDQYFNKYLNEELVAAQNVQKYLEKIRLILGLSTIFMLIITLLITYFQWKTSTISNGSLVLIIMILLNLTSFLWYLSMELIRFNEEFGRVKENMDVLFSGVLEQQNSSKIAQPMGNIEVQNLCYAYDKPLFNHLSFSIRSGKKVALTGFSGSGKTTFIHLLLSHLSLQKGQIFLDGVDIQTLSPNSLRQYFSVAAQHPTLLNRSVRDNIQYGNLSATEDEIICAAKIANCHDFILKLSKGYDTIVGERGDRLSGGQKQRIAIARALIKKSPVLILDEPTSSLDHETAILTLKNILNSIQSRTLIVITHNKEIALLMDEMIAIS